MSLHRDIAHANAARAQLDQFDVIIVHDPQPLRLVELRDHQTWIWRCHIDLSAPYPETWNYLTPIVDRYDAAVFSLPEYAQRLAVAQRFIMPAIDPFAPINLEMSRAESRAHLERYNIPLDLPLVVQAGRFDKWKDPQGVIDAFGLATRQSRPPLSWPAMPQRMTPRAQRCTMPFARMPGSASSCCRRRFVDQCAATPGCGGAAEVLTRRIRTDGIGGHVEGSGRDRR